MKILLTLCISYLWVLCYIPFREAFSDLTGVAPFFAVILWLEIFLFVPRLSRNLAKLL
jgi:hypothetical protein